MGVSMEYLGWTIGTELHAPETGKFVGYRYGVRVCAGTLEALKEIIRLRDETERERRQKGKR